MDSKQALADLVETMTPGPWKAEASKAHPLSKCIWRAGDPAADGGNALATGLWPRDADGIVAMRNTMPALLAAVEAAKQLRHERFGHLALVAGHCAMCDAAIAFDAALAAIEARGGATR